MPISAQVRQTIVDQSIGGKFGKLTVESFVEFRKTPRRGSQVPIVSCVCECGTKKNISLWDIRSGKTKSCGLNHPRYEDRSYPAFRNLYDHAYRGRAIRKGLEFSITEDEFRDLNLRVCHYCGRAPQNTSHRIASGKNISIYLYTGIDRKDSGHGYTSDNVVPCCGICNHAKHTMPYETFINWLNQIAQFRSANG